MRIVEARELTVPLTGGMANAVVSFADHTVSLVALISDRIRGGRPVTGFGFNSIGRFAQGGILRERLFPRLAAAPPEALLLEDGSLDPAAIAAVTMRNEKPGGHGDRAGAVGALELAAWDLRAKLLDQPAWRTIAEAFGRSVDSPSTTVYAAGGYYYAEDSTARLGSELAGYRDQGFQAFKIKIGGADLATDCRRIEAALTVAGAGERLSVDANGRFTESQALDYARALADYGLRWFEEPGDPLDYDLNRRVAERFPGPLATGENLFSVMDVANLVRFGGMRPERDVFQMDPGLSYGLGEYGRMLAVLESSGFRRAQCFPHGGHLVNLHAAVGLGLGGCEAYPGVFQPIGGYSAGCRLADGRVSPPDAAGFGLEQKTALVPYLEKLTE